LSRTLARPSRARAEAVRISHRTAWTMQREVRAEIISFGTGLCPPYHAARWVEPL